jgi:cytochrome c-type biogenesis protein CcmH
MGASELTPGSASARRRPLAGLVLAAALLAGAGSLAIVALRGPAGPSSRSDELRAVASGLRCPVCQDLSVADSPSALAREMRSKIAAELRSGRSPAAIRQEFVNAYGEWILMSPPRHGLSLVAWILPVILLGAGVLLAAVSVARWTGGGTTAPAEGSDAEGLAPADRRLLERALATQGRQGQDE